MKFKNIYQKVKPLTPFLAFVVGILPAACYLFFASLSFYKSVLFLNFFAWSALGFLIILRDRTKTLLDNAFSEIEVENRSGDLETKIRIFFEQSERFNKAAYFFNLDDRKNKPSLGEGLREIAEHCYKDLHCKAIELSLYDKESGLWSQTIMLGEPDSISTQSMLHLGSEESSLESFFNDGAGEVIVENLTFAGNIFGAMRVEMHKGENIGIEDRKVLRLLAKSGALLLLDARFTEELLLMKKLGDESLKAKTGFLANLSHEIRGPLSVILNGAELTMDGLCGPVTDDQKETLRMIKDNGDHLLDLVNDVLDYAKVEAGQVSAKPINIGVEDFLKDLLTLVRSQATVKRHKMKLSDVQDNLGIICDKRHSRQILINFLTNAIKYTPEGGEITLSAQLVEDQVKISIKDTGVGIPEEHRSKVFGAFERVDERYSNSQNGTGLGMPLTKKLAEVNGGSVDFVSEAGKGSTFWVSLPYVDMKECEALVIDEEEQKEISLNGKGEKVLIVDHNEDTLFMYQQYLGNQGFEIIHASSGKEVLKALKDGGIKLAVVENDLPDIGGEDMVLAIRANPIVSGIPIILLSSKAFVFDVEHFLKLGVDRCLCKPIELSELAYTARRLIDESH